MYSSSLASIASFTAIYYHHKPLLPSPYTTIKTHHPSKLHCNQHSQPISPHSSPTNKLQLLHVFNHQLHQLSSQQSKPYPSSVKEFTTTNLLLLSFITDNLHTTSLSPSMFTNKIPLTPYLLNVTFFPPEEPKTRFFSWKRNHNI